MTTVWVHSEHDYLVVKRAPFQYQVPIMTPDGDMAYQIEHGVSMLVPKWQKVVKDERTRRVWGYHNGIRYDITDLYP
jgi:hypothetical protein